MGLRHRCIAVAMVGAFVVPRGAAAAASEAAAMPAASPALPTLVVVGLQNGVDEPKWRDQRLGWSLRGRLVQMFADSGAFALVEEKDLAPSVREALGGYWLSEPSAEVLGDPDRAREHAAAEWIAYGAVRELGVTRDRVTGPVGGRRWAYRVVVRLCMSGERPPQPLCEDGEGRSVTRVISAGPEYRGDELVFDQAGPAQAIDRALADAFNRLLPRWAADG